MHKNTVEKKSRLNTSVGISKFPQDDEPGISVIAWMTSDSDSGSSSTGINGSGWLLNDCLGEVDDDASCLYFRYDETPLIKITATIELRKSRDHRISVPAHSKPQQLVTFQLRSRINSLA